MSLRLIVEIGFFSHAVAQSFDSFSGLILDEFSSSSGFEIGLSTTGTFISASSVSTTGASSLVQPTQSGSTLSTRTSVTVSPVSASTSAASSASSLSLSGTLRLVTESTNVSLSTVASTASPTVTPSASADGGANSDRVAVIALATILGALVLGFAILIPVLIRRKKLRQHKQNRSSKNQNEPSEPTSSMWQRPASWLGSFRRNHPSVQQSSAPTQQFAIATTQPLMSEGSPIYGLNSPHEARPSPLFAGVSRGRRKTTPAAVTKGSKDEALRAHRSQPPINSAPDIVAESSTAKDRPDIEHAHRTSDHDIGNPYVDANPKTPNLGNHMGDTDEARTNDFQTHDDQHHHAPLTSHPVNQSSQTERRDTLDVPTEGDDQQTERSSSIPRAGFANAIAGLGIDPEESMDKAVSDQSVVGEPSTSTVGGDHQNEDVSNSRQLQSKPFQQPAGTAKRGAQSLFVPHLKIPQSLIPGRQKSKKTRFSIGGNDEISPTSESWLGSDDAAQGHYRRPSTISPVSPERNERRVQSELVSRRRSDKRGGDRSGTTATMSAPAASSSRTEQIEYSQGSGDRNIMAPGVHHIHHEKQTQREQPKSQAEVSQFQRANITAQSVKRKPVPLTLATLIRKPLPPHPVPTSKYNQAARQSVKSQAAHASTQTSGSAPIHETAESSSQLRRKQSSQIPRVATPTVYDTEVKEQGWMHIQQGKDGQTLREDKGKARAERPASEVVDNNAIISSYMQPPSRGPSQHMPHHVQPGPSNVNKRDTMQFFEDPGNQEYARVYGSYYAQPSPVQFVSPISPQALRFPQQPPQSYLYQPHPQQQYYQVQPYQDGSRYLQPPFQQQQPPSHPQAQPRTVPAYNHEQYPYIKPVYQQPPPPQLPPAVAAVQANQGLSRNNETASTTAPLPTSYSWRESQQDAWRDSLSRSGSDPASASESKNGATSGTGVATSNASSGGGKGPGLWGNPGFFGVER